LNQNYKDNNNNGNEEEEFVINNIINLDKNLVISVLVILFQITIFHLKSLNSKEIQVFNDIS
jgi:hypothetical protein